jgi:hypothetical protein
MPSDETSTQIEEEVQTEGIQIDEELSAYVADGVVLPEDFNFMIYPVEALMVGSYTQGLPYYNVQGQAKSFWFPMAVLSSLLEEHGVMGKSLNDNYCLYSEEEIDSFAAASPIKGFPPVTLPLVTLSRNILFSVLVLSTCE